MVRKSRARAQERKQEREQERKRNQQLMIVGVIVAVAVVIGFLFVLTTVPAEAPIPDSIARYENLRSGRNDEGFPVLGNPNAPVEIVEYASFSCAGCASFHRDVFDGLLSRIESGEASFTYIPLATGSVPNPEGASRTAMCALEQGKFWEMHDVLFEWHLTLVNNAFIGNRLTSGAQALGLDMDAFNSCFNSERVTSLLTLAQTKGVGSTPTIEINGTSVAADLSTILSTIDSFGPFNNLQPGTIGDNSAVEEAPAEATEAVVEATAEATESVEEAPAEATEAVVEEATAEATESN